MLGLLKVLSSTLSRKKAESWNSAEGVKVFPGAEPSRKRVASRRQQPFVWTARMSNLANAQGSETRSEVSDPPESTFTNRCARSWLIKIRSRSCAQSGRREAASKATIGRRLFHSSVCGYELRLANEQQDTARIDAGTIRSRTKVAGPCTLKPAIE